MRKRGERDRDRESYYAFAHYGVHLQERLHLYELHLGTTMGVSQCVCAHVCLYKPSLPSRYQAGRWRTKTFCY